MTRHQHQERERWRENPGWLNKAIAVNIDVLQREAPPHWLPKLTGVRVLASEMIVDFEQLGCGAYGCVLETLDPQIVMKITTDHSEAEFVELGMPWGWPAGITRYFGALRLEGRYKLSRKLDALPAAVLWRESARLVGKIDSDDELDVDPALGGMVARVEALELVNAIYQTGQRAHLILSSTKNRVQLYARAQSMAPKVEAEMAALAVGSGEWDQFLENHESSAPALDLAASLVGYRLGAQAMRLHPVVAPLGDTLMFYLQRQVMLADLHFGNFGIVDRPSGPVWAITDPGHVVVLE